MDIDKTRVRYRATYLNIRHHSTIAESYVTAINSIRNWKHNLHWVAWVEYTHNFKYQMICKFTGPYQFPPFTQFTHSHFLITSRKYVIIVHFVYSTVLQRFATIWRMWLHSNGTDSSNRVEEGSSPIGFVYTTLHIRNFHRWFGSIAGRDSAFAEFYVSHKPTGLLAHTTSEVPNSVLYAGWCRQS